jgi:hypothetical protein
MRVPERAQPEKDDMKLPESCITSSAETLHAVVAEASEAPAATAAAKSCARSLRCLSSGYLTDAGRCECEIPEHVVLEAWRAELERGWTHSEGFFRFIWNGGQWLAYGHRGGSVRGAYCPSHCAERDGRAFAAITRAEGLRAPVGPYGPKRVNERVSLAAASA